MTVLMPLFDDAVLARRAEIVAALKTIVPGEGVIASEREMRPYESDGLTAYRQLPMVVVLPDTTEPGVTNLAVSQAVADAGFYYAPDPSSQIACTIGGNIAENSGGVHCLKYGMTTNNVLGCELVLMTGEVLRLGGKHLDSGGYDLLGIVTGSEGLLGVVTEITVRILKKPQSARAALIGFSKSEDGGECVARIIGAGLIPGGMEMMDRPAIKAAEEFVHAGYPLDVEALLIVELDGPRAEVDHLLERVQAIATTCGAVTCRASNSEEERLLFWAGRKGAFPAVGRISPAYSCIDCTIP